MSWYIHSIKNYVNFSGRARRKEYWMFYLFNCIFSILAAIIDIILGMTLISALYGLFVAIPGLSLTFRRLHDIDKSAWWLFISLIPIVGGIILFVFTVLEGTRGANRYGEDPKATGL